MVVTARTFEQLALDEPDRQWELHEGQLRAKPPMTAAHNDVMFELGHQLRRQLNRAEFRVRVNSAHVQQSAESYYVPDVLVVPTALVAPLWERPDVLEVYREPLPLVVEVWSPSTGDYDVRAKLARYQARGDREIWRLHPFERTLTAWRRQPDGSYAETRYPGGIVPVRSLPGVTIDLDALFA